MKIKSILVACFMILSGLSWGLNAQTLISHDFDDGQLDPFWSCSVQSPNYTIAEGGRVKTFWTETGYNGTRSDKGAELCCDDINFLKEGWYGVTINLGSDYPMNKTAGIAQIFQFYSSTFWSWAGIIDMENGDLTMTHRSNGGSSSNVHAVLYNNFPKQTDVNMIIHFVLSNENAGEIQVWIDGTSVYHVENINFGYAEQWTNDVQSSANSFVTFKAGQYNYDDSNYDTDETRTVYYDNISWYNGSNGYDIVNPDQSSFTPDPNKTYYIDSPYHNLRLAATGESEDAYTTSTSTTGSDVEWKFVDKGNGYWHIDRAAGGSMPRLRTDNSENADMNPTSSTGTYTYYDFSTGSISGTNFLTLVNGPSNYKRLQINSSGQVKMVTASHDGTWESFEITEASSVVNIRKRNSSGYALDGGNSGANGQNVYLWSFSSSNQNQQWEEIDRGSGYYTYVKLGTNYALDGGNGGANGQNVYLWTKDDSNYNQHWKKVDMGGGYVQLQKRNSTGFAINGGSGGANGQNVNLYNSSNSSYNLQWSVEDN
ncbi:RICIN domain-containing protein [Puniceicoccaceae bacterium K14]|nr:RICIN domain-containing protein [Puniceicoccaceae bacterium K14]